MIKGNEEASTLQMHVGIDIDKRIVSDANRAGTILLNGKLTDLWQIVGSLIGCEVGQTASQFYTQYASNLKLQVEVREDVQRG